jgi:formate dehydrogenase subunit gamma
MTLDARARRTLMAMLALALVVSAGPVLAQQPSSSGPTAASPTGSNPTAMSVNEQQLFQEFNKLQGRITIPDAQLATLEQPQGRSYRAFHERVLPWIGGIVILGMIAAIAAFYFYRGRVRLPPEERTGRTILRFNAFERLTHWMTATSFIVLALTGLNYIFGKRLLMPLLGPDAFAAWTYWAKYAHYFLAWPFMLGVLIMIAMWLRGNLPDRYDVAWIKAGGGLLGGKEPDAGRFNAGQKLVFWSVTIFGIALSVTGILLLFPFYFLDIGGMQIAQSVHATLGVILTAIIIAHIYIGTLGEEGAWDAMGTGEVDVGWARHHHRVWVEEQEKKTRGPQLGAGSASAPAE